MDLGRSLRDASKSAMTSPPPNLRLIPAVFSHTGQMHGEVKRFITKAINL